jgi:hypothetical protein
VRYRGWFNDDIEHDFPGRLNIIGGLGGKRGFNELLGTAERYGTTIYPDVYFANVFSRGNGFSPRRDAARFLDQRIARLYRYNAATYQIATQHAPSFFLSPQRLEPTVDRFLKRYQDLSNNALSLADLARTVTSDFDEDDLFDRGGAVDSIVSQLQRFRSDLSDVMIDGANAYALPYADYVVQVPPGSSRFAITDESVPFLPLVLRGFSRFALEPINRANDLTDHFLKTLETGAEISFLWTWEDASVFKDTPYDHFYSTGFSNWLEDMVDYYQELSDVRRVIGNRDVVSHRRLESEVYQTVFEDGLTLYVNYGASAYSIDEFTVEADSYLLSRTDPSRQEAQRDR